MAHLVRSPNQKRSGRGRQDEAEETRVQGGVAAAGDLKLRHDDPVRCFRFDVLQKGESHWTSNHLRFADEKAALEHARGLSSRWNVIEKIRVVREDAEQGDRYVVVVNTRTGRAGAPESSPVSPAPAVAAATAQRRHPSSARACSSNVT